MAHIPVAKYEHCSDEILMGLFFDLSRQPDENSDELAAIDAVMQSRLTQTYGAAKPGASPRVRYLLDEPSSGGGRYAISGTTGLPTARGSGRLHPAPSRS